MVCLGFEPTAADDRRRQNHGAMGAALKSFNILYNIDRIDDWMTVHIFDQF